MGGGATTILAVLRVEGIEVHLVDGVEDEEGQVVFVQPVGDRRRHEVQLVTLDRKKVVGHGPIVAIAPGQVVDLTRVLPGALQKTDGWTPGVMQQAQVISPFTHLQLTISDKSFVSLTSHRRALIVPLRLVSPCYCLHQYAVSYLFNEVTSL